MDLEKSSSPTEHSVLNKTIQQLIQIKKKKEEETKQTNQTMQDVKCCIFFKVQFCSE